MNEISSQSNNDKSDSGISFMLAEYQNHLSEYQRLEQIGEQRVNLFIAIATLMLGGGAFALFKPFTECQNITEIQIDLLNYVLLIALLLTISLGLITLIRLINRNLSSYNHRRASGRIRNYFVTKVAPGIREYLYYEPYDDRPIRKKDWIELFTLGGGGLIETVAIINSFFLSLCVLIIFRIHDYNLSESSALVLGILVFSLGWVSQFIFVKHKYRRGEPKKEDMKYQKIG